ncbi:flocculation protein FLO11-like isoform X2 [Girardinichthys multiradiatus]|nr:flocculation protein FLO11-like isoform X2 [Girardinichthys multiradiatus]XP_047220003.1 flocculation protein FLO11-like isoform X2 [Girardinichthys multiradiatus]
MTQIPARPEEDVLEEAMTDGFLVEHFFGTSSTTEPPKRNTTVQASQQPSFKVLTEGSGFLEIYAESPETSTIIQASLQPSFDISSEGSGFLETPTSPITKTPETTTIPASPKPIFDISLEESDTTQSFLSSKTESPELSTAIQTSLQPITDFTAQGSGDSSVSSLSTIKTLSASTTSTPTSTEQSVQSTTPQKSQKGTRQARIFNLNNVPNEVISMTEDSKKQVQLPYGSIPNSNKNKRQTPDWIIIVGFLVGLAALITLFAAIATRDKWNGPSQTSENKTNASNQKREQEMQTFLHKEEPKENGKDAEYTVIPLDDLADCYSSN